MNEKFHQFSCSYRIDGGEWVFTITATDHVDAQRRIAAIGMTAKVEGKILAQGQIAPSFVGRAVTWIKGFLS